MGASTGPLTCDDGRPKTVVLATAVHARTVVWHDRQRRKARDLKRDRPFAAGPRCRVTGAPTVRPRLGPGRSGPSGWRLSLVQVMDYSLRSPARMGSSRTLCTSTAAHRGRLDRREGVDPAGLAAGHRFDTCRFRAHKSATRCLNHPRNLTQMRSLSVLRQPSRTLGTVLLDPPHDPGDMRIDRWIGKRLHHVHLKHAQNLVMSEEAMTSEVHVLHPLGTALVREPSRRHTDKIGGCPFRGGA